MIVDRGDRIGPLADLLAQAGAAGGREAEVFHKVARGRRLVLEPGLLKDGRPRVTVADSVETGVALRLLGRQGGWGMAWRSPFDPESRRQLVEEALLAAALPDPERADGSAGIGCSRPRGELPAAADLGLFDAQILDRPVERLRPLLQEAAEAARELCGDRVAIDAVTLSEAVLSIDLVNSSGFEGCYTRTLALLSVLTAPAAPGARAVMEERSSSRLDDLDARGCGLDAARRSLAGRGAIAVAGASPPVVLSPRAAAELLARLVSSLLATDGVAARAGAMADGLCIVDDGRLKGAFGSAPFDGVGQPTGTTLLVRGSRLAGRLSPEGGNVIRPSLREPPALGLSNLRLAPSGGRTGAGAGGATDPRRLLDPGADPCLLIEAARCRAGRSLAIEVLRGEWHSRGAPVGPADGLTWEGSAATLLSALTAIGGDATAFHPGLPVVAPSIRLEGLGVWSERGQGARRSAGPRGGAPIRPPVLRG